MWFEGLRIVDPSVLTDFDQFAGGNDAKGASTPGPGSR